MNASSRATTALLVGAIATVTVVAGVAASSPETSRVAIAASAALFGLAVAVGYPRAALGILVVWLAALGLTRRLTTGIATSFELGDPLILVGAGVLAVLTAVAIRGGALARRTRLTSSVLLLMAVLTLSALNPAQGGISVGFAGALLVVVPMLAFFIGRALVDDVLLRQILWTYAILSVFAAGYGLFQTFVRFPTWDQRWIDQFGYIALNIGGTVRSFSSFSSSSEYSMFLAIGAVCWLTLGWRSGLRAFCIPAVVVILIALWYVSARGAVVALVAALGLVATARFRVPLLRGLVVTALMLASIPWLLGAIAPSQFGNSGPSELAAHQVSGLTDPFGKDSSLPGHVELAWEGISSAISQPLGQGVGSITIAGTKLSEDKQSRTTLSSTEQDIGNAALAAGILGLVAYVLVTALGLVGAYARARRLRTPLTLAALGVLVATVSQWLNGGQYAVVILPWLVLGWLDAPTSGDGDRAGDDVAFGSTNAQWVPHA